jgi:hypothetical protein
MELLFDRQVHVCHVATTLNHFTAKAIAPALIEPLLEQTRNHAATLPGRDNLLKFDERLLRQTICPLE